MKIREDKENLMPPVPPLDEELWRHSEYQNALVSSHGRVFSKPFWRLRKLTPNAATGYHVICGSDKNYYVHRLVAEAFVPGQFTGAHVNHIDGNKLNNHYTNLEWCTQKENNRHAFATGLRKAKISQEDLERLIHKARTTDVRLADLAEEFGVTAQYVGQLLKGKYRDIDKTNMAHRRMRGKMSEDKARELINRLQSGEPVHIPDLAKEYGISRQNIANIIAGRSWKTITGGKPLEGMNLVKRKPGPKPKPAD